MSCCIVQKFIFDRAAVFTVCVPLSKPAFHWDRGLTAYSLQLRRGKTDSNFDIFLIGKSAKGFLLENL
jgi:hypothetical protein